MNAESVEQLISFLDEIATETHENAGKLRPWIEHSLNMKQLILSIANR